MAVAAVHRNDDILAKKKTAGISYMSTLSNQGNTPSCTCAKCRNTHLPTRNLTGMKHPYGHTNALVTHLTSFRFAPAFFHFPRPWRISRWHFVLGVEEACGSRRVRLSVHDSSRVWDSMGRITRCLLSWMMTWSSATLGYQCCPLKQRDCGSNWHAYFLKLQLRRILQLQVL